MTKPMIVKGLVAGALVAVLALSAAPTFAHSVPQVAPKPAVALAMTCPPPADDATVQVMIDIDSAFVRKAADWNSVAVGRVLKYQCFLPTGRNANGEWLMIPYGASVAWIHTSMVTVRGDHQSLPLSEDVVSRAVLMPAIPKGLPLITYRARQIYLSGARTGKDLKTFTVIGDCNSEPPVYLGRFAATGLNPYGYTTLKSTALYFSKSFTRTSVATQGSFNASMAFDSTWADARVCLPGEGPLACELRVSKASVLFVALGTGDQHTWREFETHFRAIVDYTVKAGVLPVLMTKADELESQEGGAPKGYINDVIRKVGKEYGVPVADFWLATRNLPNNGLAEERNNALQATNSFHLNEHGMDSRILMTLLTLKSISGR